MDDASVMAIFEPLWADVGPEFEKERPLLAHYTSMVVLEQILFNDEVWFGNPLFMNDLEEVRFGIVTAGQLMLEREKEIETACGSSERASVFRTSWVAVYNQFTEQQVFDTYVLCLSRHQPDDYDGKLSMWRGYGANGTGAAIVIDTAQLATSRGSPLIIAEVKYQTSDVRREQLTAIFQHSEQLIAEANIPDDKLHLAAYALFERVKLFALFTKHHGFSEEEEWRIVYMPNRDPDKTIHGQFHYWIGPRGVEPKLKFKILPVKGLTSDDFSLQKVTDRILLGPTISSPLAIQSVMRMLEVINKSELKSKVRASGIPFRA